MSIVVLSLSIPFCGSTVSSIQTMFSLLDRLDHLIKICLSLFLVLYFCLLVKIGVLSLLFCLLFRFRFGALGICIVCVELRQLHYLLVSIYME